MERSTHAGRPAVSLRPWHWAVVVGLVGLLVLESYPRLWGSGESRDPTPFYPTGGFQGAAVEIPRGQSLLFLVIQRLCDYTARTTYYVGEDPPQTTINVPQAVKALDFASAQGLLAQAGYRLTEEVYRGKKVYWVQRLIVAPRGKGKLTRRRGGKTEEPESESVSPQPVVSAGVSLFERRDGSGSRFLLTFETNSRREANDALLLLEAFRAKKVGQRR